jgi:hypothetical protein
MRNRSNTKQRGSKPDALMFPVTTIFAPPSQEMVELAAATMLETVRVTLPFINSDDPSCIFIVSIRVNEARKLTLPPSLKKHT